jgi:UTP--glucose-1-phosphate uridylyltransferase|tara:strand:+ start:1084 stop:1899 length:816 start_codon:yes stop_codon:yes gene_type:complete
MIKQAIIPLAGLGTRLLPLTSVFAKELLPINGKPGLEYIIEECINAGIKEIIFIISRKKMMIKNYFYKDKFYRNLIKKKKDQRIVNEYKKILKYKRMIKFVYQDSPKGTGDAVLKTQRYIKDKYFLMLLPDDLIVKKNCSKSMINSHKKYKASVMACMTVNKKTVSRWGIYKLSKKLNKNDYLISGVIEKPLQKNAPSNKAVIGRYILPRSIFSKLKHTKPNKGGEIHITDAIQSLIDDNEKFIAHKFSGKYLDCGTMNGYINSSKEIAKI